MKSEGCRGRRTTGRRPAAGGRRRGGWPRSSDDGRAEVARFSHGDRLGHERGGPLPPTQSAFRCRTQCSCRSRHRWFRVPRGAAISGVGVAHQNARRRSRRKPSRPPREDPSDLHLHGVADAVVHRSVMPESTWPPHQNEVAVASGCPQVRNKEREGSPRGIHVGPQANADGTRLRAWRSCAPPSRVTETIGVLGSSATVPGSASPRRSRRSSRGTRRRRRGSAPPPQLLRRRKDLAGFAGPSHRAARRASAGAPALPGRPGRHPSPPAPRPRRGRRRHGVRDARDADRRIAENLQESRHRPTRPAIGAVLLNSRTPTL